MTDPPATPADRLRWFGEARQHLGRSLADIMPQVAAELGRLLEEASVRAEAVDASQLARAARVVAAAAPDMAAHVPVALNEFALRRMEWLATQAGPDLSAPTLALYDEAELGEQLALEEIASAIRLSTGAEYQRLTRVVGELLGRPVSEETMPIGARAIAAAVIKAMNSREALRPYWRTIRQRLPRVLPPLAAAAVADLLGWLAGQGLLGAPQSASRSIPAGAPGPSFSPGPSFPPASSLPPVSRAPSELPPSVDEATRRFAASQTPPPGTPPPATPPTPSPATRPVSTTRAPSSAASPPQPGAPTPAPAPSTPASPSQSLESPTVVERAADLVADALVSGSRIGAQGIVAHAQASRSQRLSVLDALRGLHDDAIVFAHRVEAEPYSRVARRRLFAQMRTRVAAQGSEGRLAIPVVDLIDALFDYAIDDARLPEAARPLMWRLQTPVLMLALLDSQYLGDDRRSVRRLVENLAAIVTAFPEEVTVGSELQRRLDTAVRAVEIVGSTLYTRASVLAEQTDRALGRGAEQVAMIAERVGNERRALERTPDRRNRRDPRRRPDRTREREVTERLAALLEERLERHRVPDSVREFLRDIWLRHLRTAVLRDGENSPEYRVALQVVDDLLWSLDSRGERQSRRQLVERIPPLIRTLTQGIRAVGASSGQFKAFFDELFLIHLRKLQRGRGNGAEVTAPDVVSPDVVSPDAAPPDAAPPDAVSPGRAPAAAGREVPRAGQDTGGSEPTPLDEEDAASGSERRLRQVLSSLDLSDFPVDFERRALDAHQALEQMRRGDWIELRMRDGAATFAKVAWINARRTVVLLVRIPDRRALSLRASELRSRFTQGRAFLIGARG